MAKLSNSEYAEKYQDAWDNYNSLRNAYGSAFNEQRKILSNIIKREQIKRAEMFDKPLEPGHYSPLETGFNATEAEKEALRNLEIEISTYKRLFLEKNEALEYLEKRKKPLERDFFSQIRKDILARAMNPRPIDEVIFKTTVFIAALIVIIKSF